MMKESVLTIEGDVPETSRRVLVIDDDAFLRDLLSRFLTRKGFSVSVAGDAAEALAAVKEQTYHVALTDIVLPGMDGIALIDQLKERNPSVIIIMMTGHPSLETALKALKKGVDDYLVKPFKLEQIDEVIRRCLEKRKVELENQELKNELLSAKEQIKKYETLIRQAHVLNIQSGHDAMPGRMRADAEYRFQSVRNRETMLREHLDTLTKLREEGILSEEEFEHRRKQITLKDEETHDTAPERRTRG